MAVLIVVIRHKYNSVNPIMYENRNPCRSTDCSDSFCVHYKVNRDFQKKKKIHVFNGSRTLTRLLRSVAWSSWWGFVMKLPVYRGKMTRTRARTLIFLFYSTGDIINYVFFYYISVS